MVACSALALHLQPASAATLSFRGLALGTCTLTAPIDGVMTLGSDLSSWTTTTPASIVATNTAVSVLTVTRGSDWATSPAGTPLTSFDFSASLIGVNTGALTGTSLSKTHQLPTLGVSTLSMWLSGVASSPFPAGNYVAQVTVTCATQ